MNTELAQEILAEIRAKQSPRELCSRSREVYKEEKKEIQNYTSRLPREDVDGVEVSGETCLLAQRQAFDPVAVTSSLSPLEGTSCQERGGSVISAPREVSSRYSGISVQHVKTAKGIKLAITLQKPEWAATGDCQMATAELKRYDRMREVKSREQDSDHFAHYLANAKKDLQDAKNINACIGRLHQRKKRSAWLYDTLVIGFFENNKMSTVMLYLEGEEHVIEMNIDLTDTQSKYYLCQGRFGNITQGNRAPKLDDLPLEKFGGN